MSDFIRTQFEQVQAILRDFAEGIDFTGLLIGLAATLVVTIFFWLLSRVVKGFTSRLAARVVRRTEFIRPLRFQQQDIFSAEDIVKILTGLTTGLRYLLNLILFYFYLNVVFTFFPGTQAWAAGLFGLVVSAFTMVITAAVGYLPNLVIILVVILLARWLVRLASLIFDGIASGRITIHGFYSDWAKPTFNIFRFLVVVGTAVVIYPYIPGSDSAAFQGVSIFLGVLFSLGSTGAVANVVAGVVMTYMRAFQIGDRIRLAQTEGDVVEKTLFVTRVRTIKNVEITIPNSMVLSNHVINFSALADESGLVIHTTVTIGYDVPWRRVHELLIEAARATEGIEAEPQPFVLQSSLNDFYVSYELNAYTNDPRHMAVIYSRLHQNIQDAFHTEGLEITSPHFSAIRDGNRTTIPEEYLSECHQTPAFRVQALDRLFGRKKDDK